MQRRGVGYSDLGQTAIVAVLALVLIIGVIGGTLVLTVVQSTPLQQTASLADYSNQAVTAGENAYVTAVNANPGLAYCSTQTVGTGKCLGINYGEWTPITGTASTDTGAEYYTYGNPQPTFDPTTHELTNLAVEVVGAAKDPQSSTGYIFAHKVLNLAPKNGFLSHVWWSNYESYSPNGDYSTCGYNWSSGINYDIDGSNASCSSQVYFGPNDYLFGPTFTNDSVFVSGDGTQAGSPSFGNPNVTPQVASSVETADPNCQFVDDNNRGTQSTDGMNSNGTAAGYSTCANASKEVYLFDQANSTYGNPVEAPPSTDSQLGTIASYNGCLYSGPTQITLSTDTSGVGQMTVVSPDTPESVVNGNTLDTNNILTNTNNCPNNGTAPLPLNGVVFVQNATAGQAVTGANPFDDYVTNSATNLTSSPAAPTPSNSVTLTATVTSAVQQISSGATVAFSQTTSTTSYYHTTTSSAVIPACSAVSNWSAPVAVGSNWQSTATCTTTEASNGTGAFSAAYSGGTYVSASQGNLGQTNSYSSTVSYAANSQTTAGGCTACYYGETGTPDSEGDAFVNGNLSGQLTIGTANDVIVDGNITYEDCSGQWVTGQSGSSAQSEGLCPYVPGGTNDSLGLIANEYVEVNHPVTSGNYGSVLPACAGTPGALCDPSAGTGNVSTGTGGITIDAAILALTQSFVVNNYGTGGDEGPLYVYGSIQQFARGPVGTFSGNTTASGYVKHYTWDPLLDFLAPPSYLVPTTPSWVLTSVTADSSAVPTTFCPTLLPVYGSTQSISQYCATNPGALPGYPSVTAPAPPTSVTATAGIGGFATVSWVDPANHGSPIIRYNVSPMPSCGTCTGTTVTGATATSASIGGLTPGVSYVFTVTATNGSGTSDPSLPSPSTATPAVPYAPTQVTAAGNANDTVTVGWTDPASPGYPITKYTVTPSPACGSCTGLVVTSATATSTTISGLSVGGTYTFTVTATNAVGTGPLSLPSNSVVVPTTPGAPTGVTATSFANGQSVVSWTPPGSNGGLPITGYRVTSSSGMTCTTTGNTSCTVTGLTNGMSYTFTVTATNAIGTGPASAASAPATPAALPGTPTIGSATASNGSAMVTFSAPAANGGAPVTSYTVTATDTTTTANGGQTSTGSASPITVTGLTNGDSYTFKVAATNGAGTGPSSASSNSVTPIGPPVAPTNVAATSNANTQSVVTWAASASTGGSTITHYTVTSNGGQTCTTANGTTTTCTVTGLTNGTSYTFTVTATNAVGTSAASAPSAPAIPATAPGPPTGVTAVGGYTQGTVSWTAPASNGGAAITGYTVMSSPGAKTCTTSTTSCIVTGLTDLTSYTFTVVAINSAGTSASSVASNAVVPTTTVPNPPTNVTATSYANTQSVVSWTAPAYTGGATINQYIVTSSPGAKTCTTAATSCTVTGLTNGVAYTFTVTAAHTTTAPTGPSAPSVASASATPSTVPQAPTIGSASYTAGIAYGANPQVAVTWTDPANSGGSAITGYTVTSSPAGGTCTVAGATATACTITSGLTAGTAYTFSVVATNGSGTSAASAASAAIVPATVPGTPTAVTATSNVSGQSVVSWTAPASNGGLAITGYTVTSSVGQTCTTTGATTCTVTGLTNGTAYTFTVTATSPAGTGAASAASNPATPGGPPQPPTGVTATTGQNVSSTVSWTAPTDNGGSVITGYTVTASPGTRTCTTTGATSCTVTGLTNGTTYTFTVTATNAVGTSAASAPSNAITPASTPGAPTDVTATNVPGTPFTSTPQVMVSWTAPVVTGGSAITSYTVTSSGGHPCTTGNGNTTTCTFLGLTAGTNYTFTVMATNVVGTGPASAPVSATASTVPGAPTGVTATSFANAQSVVTWTAPASNGGSSITGYTVTSSGGQTCTSTSTAPATPATTCTVTGLTNGTAYTFTVTATNVNGTGPASAASASATPATTPGAPTGATATASTVSTQAAVTWTAPSTGGAVITGYTVTSSVGQTCTVGTVTGVTGSTATYTGALTCNVTGLTAKTSYTFTVTATNAAGTSSASTASNSVIAGAPGTPTGVTATSFANAQSVVTWTAPNNGGATIAKYTVTSSGGQTCTSTSTAPATPATTCTVTGLTNGTAYTFTVTATNVNGTGPASAASASATPATTPGAPTGVAGTSNANAQSVVTWTAPASNGGSSITGYTVTSSGGQTCSSTSTAPATPATTCTVTGLTNGTAYTFTVTATNAAGTSSASAASGTATPATTPGAPTGVAATSFANAQSVVTWTAPSTGGAVITGYTVTSSGGQTCTSTSTAPATPATTCTVTGLTNGTAYTFTVTATNVVGTGSASAASASATPATVPGAPTTPTAAAADQSAVVSWTAPASNGGAAISTYTVTSTPGSFTCSSATSPCTVTGLTANTSYTFTVKATNAAGTGAASVATTGVTPTPTPTLVEQVSTAGTSSGTGNTLTTAALGSNTTVGDVMIATIGTDYTGSATVTGLSGGGVSTWTKVYAKTGTGGGTGDIEVWYGYVTSAATTGVKATTSSSSLVIRLLNASEWSGLAASSPVDTSATGTGSSLSFTAGPITTTQAGDLVISDAWTANTSGTSVQNSTTSGYTALSQTAITTKYQGWAAYQVVGATGGYSAGWTEAGSTAANYATGIVAFKA